MVQIVTGTLPVNMDSASEYGLSRFMIHSRSKCHFLISICIQTTCTLSCPCLAPQIQDKHYGIIPQNITTKHMAQCSTTGLLQYYSISSADSLDILQSCTEPQVSYNGRIGLSKLLYTKSITYCKTVQCNMFPLLMHWRYRDHFVYVPSQWETTLQYNIISYWLGTYTKWSHVYSQILQFCATPSISYEGKFGWSRSLYIISIV